MTREGNNLEIQRRQSSPLPRGMFMGRAGIGNLGVARQSNDTTASGAHDRPRAGESATRPAMVA
jgi:hypothetical protein